MHIEGLKRIKNETKRKMEEKGTVTFGAATLNKLIE